MNKCSGKIWRVIEWLRFPLGLFFLIVACMKSADVLKLQSDLANFDVFPADWTLSLAYIGIAMEMVLGLCLIGKCCYKMATLMGIALTSSFVAMFAQGWLRGLTLSCNCLGIEREVTSYPFEIGWRLALLGLMLLLAWISWCVKCAGRVQTPDGVEVAENEEA